MRNILIVDDESAIRQSLQGALEDEGYKAATVESGERCLEVLKKQPFEVVLLDIWLPGIDGLETLSQIRQLDDAPPTGRRGAQGGGVDEAERRPRRGGSRRPWPPRLPRASL